MKKIRLLSWRKNGKTGRILIRATNEYGKGCIPNYNVLGLCFLGGLMGWLLSSTAILGAWKEKLPFFVAHKNQNEVATVAKKRSSSLAFVDHIRYG